MIINEMQEIIVSTINKTLILLIILYRDIAREETFKLLVIPTLPKTIIILLLRLSLHLRRHSK